MINEAFSTFDGEISELLQILGWTVRLVFYYKEVPPVGEVVIPELPSRRQLEVQAALEGQVFEEGQELEAVVRNIKGNKVTYEVMGSVRLTEKEPKSCNLVTLDQPVIVRVEKLQDDGSLKKVKYLRSR